MENMNMENKNLDEQELENVSGGVGVDAVRPVIPTGLNNGNGFSSFNGDVVPRVIKIDSDQHSPSSKDGEAKRYKKKFYKDTPHALPPFSR